MVTFCNDGHRGCDGQIMAECSAVQCSVAYMSVKRDLRFFSSVQFNTISLYFNFFVYTAFVLTTIDSGLNETVILFVLQILLSVNMCVICSEPNFISFYFILFYFIYIITEETSTVCLVLCS